LYGCSEVVIIANSILHSTAEVALTNKWHRKWTQIIPQGS